MFGFLALLAVLTCFLFGLAPALRASRAAPASAMRGVRTTTASRERNGLRRTLVVAQIALSLVLLVAALLFTRSLRKLLETDLGFDSHNVLVANFTSNQWNTPSANARGARARDLEYSIRSLAGVTSVGSTAFAPFSGKGWNDQVHSDCEKANSAGAPSWFNRAGPDYFATLGTPSLAGRAFNLHDDSNAPKVAIVNNAFAKHFFAGQNPVGRSFRVPRDAGKPDDIYRIVGLVGATTYNEVREPEPNIAYFPTAQDPEPGNDMTLIVRGRESIHSLEAAIQQQAAKVDPTLLVDYQILAVQVQDSVLLERLMANLSLAFAILAGCLSTLGLYGVMSYTVMRRRNEIGIRFALGASRRNVYQLVAKDATLMVAAGLVVGVVTSLLLSRYAESLLFGLKGNDPLTLFTAALLLAITAVFAT